MKDQDKQNLQPQDQLDVSSLAEKFLENSQVLALKEQLKKAHEEIAHLKQLLMSYSPLVGQPEVAPVTDEEIITLKQLERLKQQALIRELTLDEVKRMDLLVKNKRLAQGAATQINDNKKDLPRDVSPAQLIEIATKKIIE